MSPVPLRLRWTTISTPDVVTRFSPAVGNPGPVAEVTPITDEEGRA